MKEDRIYPAGRGNWPAGQPVIAHLDMDAFYASVEIHDFPELEGTPLVVGGRSNRGVVAAASYRAREFGIHSAMPMFQAKRLCPRLVVRPGRMERYLEVSSQVMKALHSFSPLVEQISIDEAWIDLTGTEKLFGPPPDAARKIKAAISAKTGLTCSIGVSTSKLAAKIASDFDKPDGLTVVPPGRALEFIGSLPVGRIPGIGSRSEEELARIGIRKVADIGRLSPRFVRERFGRFGDRLLDIAAGRIGGEVVPWSRPKSVSNEVTLGEDTDDVALLEDTLLDLSEKVARRLRKGDLRGRTVTLKLKDAGHRLTTRSVTLERPTCQGRKIYLTARDLLRERGEPGPTRLIGVGVSNLEDGAGEGQYGLFDRPDGEDERWDRVDTAVDRILDRFGSGSVRKGRVDR